MQRAGHLCAPIHPTGTPAPLARTKALPPRPNPTGPGPGEGEGLEAGAGAGGRDPPPPPFSPRPPRHYRVGKLNYIKGGPPFI